MNTVYIGLGSNLGDREQNIKNAIEALGELEDTMVVQYSSNFETQAENSDTNTPDYLNAAVELATELPPQDLMENTQAIEIKLGRTEKNSFNARTIDIDILLYGDEIILEENLTIPHPLMHERYFVLAPLAEIAPEVEHPILGQPVSEMFAELDY